MQKTMSTRIRVIPDTWNDFQKIAHGKGISAASLVRMLIAETVEKNREAMAKAA